MIGNYIVEGTVVLGVAAFWIVVARLAIGRMKGAR